MAVDQEQKRSAAIAYDYEGDPRWAEYWSNVLVPDHLSSRPDVVRHFQLKFYQRFIDSDVQVDSLASISSIKSSSARSSAAAAQQRPVSSGSPLQNGGSTRVSPPRQAGMLRLDRASIQFLGNAWVIVMACIAMFPFLPRSLGDRAYSLALLGTALACIHSLYSQFGSPRSWNWQGLQTWLQSVVMGADFLHLLFCIVFASAFVPIKYAVIPVVCRSLEQVPGYLKNNFSNTTLYRKYLGRPSVWLDSNRNTLRMLSANSEIGLGFLLIFLVITPQRNLVQVLVYWQLLKLKFHAPNSSAYHRGTWSNIGARLNPLIARFVPFLATPIAYAQRWFLNVG